MYPDINEIQKRRKEDTLVVEVDLLGPVDRILKNLKTAIATAEDSATKLNGEIRIRVRGEDEIAFYVLALETDERYEKRLKSEKYRIKSDYESNNAIHSVYHSTEGRELLRFVGIEIKDTSENESLRKQIQDLESSLAEERKNKERLKKLLK
jgi:hypothetical protein